MSTSYEERRRKAQAAAPKDNKGKVALVATLVTLLVVAAVGWAVWSQRSHQSELEKQIAGATNPPHTTADGSGIVVNPGRAKHGAPTLTVFQDFQCPNCKRAEDATGQAVNQLADAGKITLVYRIRTFLDDNMRQSGVALANPDSSVRASAAAACADAAGKFGPYHDAVYAGQPAQEGQGYTDQELTSDFAAKAGLTGDALAGFQTCVKDGKMKGFAVKMDQAAARAGVNSTPEYQLNGNKLDLNAMLTDPTYLSRSVQAATK